MVKFIREDKDSSMVYAVCNGEDETWMSLMDKFVMFLKGCGYFIEDEDIVDYFSE